MSDPIVRSVPFEITRATTESDGMTLEGYAAVFDTPTRIDNPYEGTFDEQIARSAFDKSIHDRAQWPVMMFEHGRHILIGNMPIGVISTMRSDAKGLFVRARLTDNWLTSPVRDAIAAGAVKGMSFRAMPMNHTVDKSTDPPTVTRTELKLFELGPVVEPAYEQTSVTVRSKTIADALTDPDQRRDLALALLSPISGQEPPEGHSDVARSTQDGPPGGHPTDTTDRPPDGHPSPPETPPTSDNVIRAQFSRIDALVGIAERSSLR